MLIRNKGFRAEVVLVLAAVLLTACGGGGSDSNTPSVTPQDGAEAAVLAASLIGIGNSGEGQTQFSSSRSRQNLVLNLGGVDLPGTGSTYSAKSELQPCQGGGTTTVDDPVEKNVDSPYSDENFSVTRYTDDNCTEVDSGPGYTFHTTYDGITEEGAPVSQDFNTDPAISYESIGEGTEPYRISFAFSTTEGSGRGTFDLLGRLHSRESESSGTTDEELILSLVGTITEPQAGSIRISLGNSASPFMYSDTQVENGLEVILNGPMAVAISDLPSCAQGVMGIETVEPLELNNQGDVVGGMVELTLNGSVFEIEFLANGDCIVTVNGTSQTFTAAELEALSQQCGAEIDVE